MEAMVVGECFTWSHSSCTDVVSSADHMCSCEPSLCPLFKNMDNSSISHKYFLKKQNQLILKSWHEILFVHIKVQNCVFDATNK